MAEKPRILLILEVLILGVPIVIPLFLIIKKMFEEIEEVVEEVTNGD